MLKLKEEPIDEFSADKVETGQKQSIGSVLALQVNTIAVCSGWGIRWLKKYILLLHIYYYFFCSIVYVKDLELSFVPDSDLWWQEQEYKDEEPSIWPAGSNAVGLLVRSGCKGVLDGPNAMLKKKKSSK